LLLACLVAAFALPYGLVWIMQTYNDARWAKSGMSLHEIDEWERVGMIDVETAVRWRNANFKAPGASIWIKEGIGPEDAGQWQAAGFYAHEARAWTDHGFNASEAAEWRENGFYYTEAADWKKTGVSPAQAAARKKKDKKP
jgi:hypothetical protein